jgi:hypothetical protein
MSSFALTGIQCFDVPFLPYFRANFYMRIGGLSLGVLLLIANTVVAQKKVVPTQRWSVGAKGGISIPNLRAPKNDVGFNGGYKSVIGPQAGILVEYWLNKDWSVQSGLNYSTQGGIKEGDQRVSKSVIEAYLGSSYSLPDYLYARFNNKITLDYIELPLLAKYNISLGKNTRLAVMAGPYIGQMIKAVDVVSGGPSYVFKNAAYNDTFRIRKPFGSTSDSIPLVINFERTEDVIDQFHRLNYGIQGGLYFGYALKPVEVFLASEGTYGFRYLQKDERFGKNQTGGVTITAGLMFKL